MKEKLSLSALLTLAVALISTGLEMARQGQPWTAAVMVAVGFALILVGTWLYEQGVIEKARRLAG